MAATSNHDRLALAVAARSEAAALAGAGNHADAMNAYIRAAANFLFVANHHPVDAARPVLKGAATECVDAAERMKQHVAAGAGRDAARATAASDAAPRAADADGAAMKTAMLSTRVEATRFRWDDIVGLTEAKSVLREATVMPLLFPTFFEGAREPWRGVLLYGPPGTGKTVLAKAAAGEARGAFFNTSAADFTSKWVGDAEKAMRCLFRLARDEASAIIFVDEIDSICQQRGDATGSESSRRMLTEFLVQMNELREDPACRVIVVAATNTPWLIDEAVRRRLERRIYVGLPTSADRVHMFRRAFAATPHALGDADFAAMGAATDGYSGADVSVVMRDAAMSPLRRIMEATHFCRDAATGKWRGCSPDAVGAVERDYTSFGEAEFASLVVERRDVDAALRRIRPSVNAADLRRHDEFTRDYGQTA